MAHKIRFSRWLNTERNINRIQYMHRNTHTIEAIPKENAYDCGERSEWRRESNAFTLRRDNVRFEFGYSPMTSVFLLETVHFSMVNRLRIVSWTQENQMNPTPALIDSNIDAIAWLHYTLKLTIDPYKFHTLVPLAFTVRTMPLRNIWIMAIDRKYLNRIYLYYFTVTSRLKPLSFYRNLFKHDQHIIITYKVIE